MEIPKLTTYNLHLFKLLVAYFAFLKTNYSNDCQTPFIFHYHSRISLVVSIISASNNYITPSKSTLERRQTSTLGTTVRQFLISLFFLSSSLRYCYHLWFAL